MTSIQQLIQQLVRERTLSPELYEIILKIAGVHLRDARAKGLPCDITAEDLAGDFVVALAGEEICSEITNAYQLGREYKRWLTRRDAPEQAELWQALSTAILSLERAGRVERSPSQRRFHNTNKTLWYLPGNQDAKVRWEAEVEIAAELPSARRKSDHDRVLKPDEAEEMILIVIRLLHGPVPFGAISRNIRQKLPVLVTVPIDAPLSGNDDEKPRCLQDIIEGPDSPAYMELLLDEQISASTAGIWEGAGNMKRGGKKEIEGRRILCCYLIPKDAGGEKIVLETFGPTSTVQDMVSDLKALLQEWLSNIGLGGDSSTYDEYIRLNITRGVMEKLAKLCSENDYCRAFYKRWGLELQTRGGGA